MLQNILFSQFKNNGITLASNIYCNFGTAGTSNNWNSFYYYNATTNIYISKADSNDYWFQGTDQKWYFYTSIASIYNHLISTTTAVAAPYLATAFVWTNGSNAGNSISVTISIASETSSFTMSITNSNNVTTTYTFISESSYGSPGWLYQGTAYRINKMNIGMTMAGGDGWMLWDTDNGEALFGTMNTSTLPFLNDWYEMNEDGSYNAGIGTLTTTFAII